METKRCDCEYKPKKVYKIGLITFCSVSPKNCPYKKSLKLSSEENPLFRCITDGKVERIVKKEVLVMQ